MLFEMMYPMVMFHSPAVNNPVYLKAQKETKLHLHHPN